MDVLLSEINTELSYFLSCRCRHTLAVLNIGIIVNRYILEKDLAQTHPILLHHLLSHSCLLE